MKAWGGVRWSDHRWVWRVVVIDEEDASDGLTRLGQYYVHLLCYFGGLSFVAVKIPRGTEVPAGHRISGRGITSPTYETFGTRLANMLL